MDLLDILRLVRTWFWLICLAGLIGGAAGLAVALSAPKTYQASTIVYIHSPNHSDYQTLLGDQETAKAFAEFPSSGVVLAATLEAVHDRSHSVSQFANMVTVSNVRQTQFVSINVRAPSPVEAATLAAQLTRLSVTQFQGLASDAWTKQFTQHEMGTLQGEIRILEDALDKVQRHPLNPLAAPPRSVSELNSTLNTDRTLYNQLLNASAGMNGPQVSLLQQAAVPSAPVGTGGTRGRVTAAVLGFLAGIIAVVGVLLLVESAYRRQGAADSDERVA